MQIVLSGSALGDSCIGWELTLAFVASHPKGLNKYDTEIK